MEHVIRTEEDVKKYGLPEGIYYYVRQGGIVKVRKEGEKVVVVYPNKKFLRERIKELKEKLTDLKNQLSSIESSGKSSTPFFVRAEHIVRKMVDKEYRYIVALIDGDRLLNDKRGIRILEQLMKNKEYRKTILDTLKESPVYKGRKFAEFIEKADEVRKSVVEERKKKLMSKIEETEKVIKALKELERMIR